MKTLKKPTKAAPEITERELKRKLNFLGVDEETQKSVACSMIGHSRIQHFCFGYYTCARCGAQVGDSLGGSFDGSKSVIVGHKCDVCVENLKGCTWKDTFMCPDPFAETEEE